MNRAMLALACSLGLFASSPMMASDVEGYIDTVTVNSEGLVSFKLKNFVIYNYSLPFCAQQTGFVTSFAIHPSETAKQPLRDMVMNAADGKTKLRVWNSNSCWVTQWPLIYVQGVGGISSTSAP